MKAIHVVIHFWRHLKITAREGRFVCLLFNAAQYSSYMTKACRHILTNRSNLSLCTTSTWCWGLIRTWAYVRTNARVWTDGPSWIHAQCLQSNACALASNSESVERQENLAWTRKKKRYVTFIWRFIYQVNIWKHFVCGAIIVRNIYIYIEGVLLRTNDSLLQWIVTQDISLGTDKRISLGTDKRVFKVQWLWYNYTIW